MSIDYLGSNFYKKIGKCKCKKPAEVVRVSVYHGEIMNTKTGERYLDCKIEYFCKEHE